MLGIRYTDGGFEIEDTDKIELKVRTLVEQGVDTIFIAKKKSDVETFEQVVKEQ